MMFRHALIAVTLVSGTATIAAAQSEEFPFRRFGERSRLELRHFMPPLRNSFRYSDRFRFDNERIRVRLQDRARDLADRVRDRDFFFRDNRNEIRSRAFALRDLARRRQMDLRNETRDRIRDRVRLRMDHFRFDRPLIMRRHSGII